MENRDIKQGLEPITPPQRIDFPEMVANLMHNLPGIAYRCYNDEQWTMIYISEGCASVTGYPSAALLNNNLLSFDDLIHEDDKDYVRECVDNAVSSRTRYQMEYRIIDNEGKVRWVWEQGSAVYDANNDARFLDGYIADITSRKKIEEEMKQVAKNLEEMNTTKDKFFSLIAHDLRNPVYAIMSLTEFLDQNHASFNEMELRTFLNQVNLSAKGIYGLLENLLDWGKIQTGSFSVQRDYLSLNKLVSYVLEQFLPICKEKDVAVVFNEGEDILVESDTRILSSIIRNLVSNAIKYSHPNSKVKLSINREDDSVKLSIADKGIGIARRDLDKLFSIDNEIRRPGTINEPGSGLGLILVKGFADILGINVHVSSKTNHGSTFTLVLPDAPGSALPNR